MSSFSASQTQRYSRHLILPEVGVQGQQKLKNSSVLIVGAGGLGSPAALYLAAAGVGKLGIVDFDNIDLSNLQRQIIHSTADVGTSKCQSAKKRLAEINPDVSVQTHEERLSADNALRLVGQYDVVLDATDNFSTRYMVNDACVLAGKPNVYGAIYRFEGQASLFAPGGPCYRCIFPDPPPPDAVPNCAEGGVLGVLAGIIGVIQATEVIKYLLALGDSLSGRLLLYDALAMRFDTLKISRSASCPVCGDNRSITKVIETVVACATDEAVAAGVSEISVAQLKARFDAGTSPVLLDVRNEQEHELGHLSGAKLIPLGKLQESLAELDKGREIVVYCKSGGRSKRAAELLIANGFANVKNLTGGILEWADKIDPSMPKY